MQSRDEERLYAVDLAISVRVYADDSEHAEDVARSGPKHWDDWFLLAVEDVFDPEERAAEWKPVL